MAGADIEVPYVRLIERMFPGAGVERTAGPTERGADIVVTWDDPLAESAGASALSWRAVFQVKSWRGTAEDTGAIDQLVLARSVYERDSYPVRGTYLFALCDSEAPGFAEWRVAARVHHVGRRRLMGSCPYAPLWRQLTEKPRAWYEMNPIAWGAFPDADPEENLTCDASELADVGDVVGARKLLMEALHRDLRCLDGHAHLGTLLFDRSPDRAIVHYEIGMRIGDLSLSRGFDGVLVWGVIYNRPFLRCLHGYGLCLWRLGRVEEAQQVFERILSLNPNDNQGVRFCLQDVRNGRSWEETR